MAIYEYPDADNECLETIGPMRTPMVNRQLGIYATANCLSRRPPQRSPEEIPAWEVDQNATRRIIALIDSLFPETPGDWRALHEIRRRVLTLNPLVQHDVPPTPPRHFNA